MWRKKSKGESIPSIKRASSEGTALLRPKSISNDRLEVVDRSCAMMLRTLQKRDPLRQVGGTNQPTISELEINMIKASTAPYAALLLRVSLGIMFLAHVGLKVFVFTIPGFVGYFGSLGLPAILAYAVVALEFFGGLALILGVYAPLVALPLALEMLGTIVFAHGANGWLFTNKGGGWEFPAFWMVGLIALYLLGDGAMALKPAQRNAT